MREQKNGDRGRGGDAGDLTLMELGGRKSENRRDYNGPYPRVVRYRHKEGVQKEGWGESREEREIKEGGGRRGSDGRLSGSLRDRIILRQNEEEKERQTRDTKGRTRELRRSSSLGCKAFRRGGGI